MILPTMTDMERERELLDEFRRFVKRFNRETVNKWDKAAMKQSVFPKIYHWSETTARKNTLHIVGYIHGRKAVHEGYVSIMYTTMRTDKGTHLFMYTDYKGEYLYIFPPHALERYSSRLNLCLGGSEVAEHYIRRQVASNGGGDYDKETGRCIMSTDDGIWMGKQLSDHSYLFKTFVDNTLLYKDQLEEGDECKTDFDEFLDMTKKYFKGLK